MPSGRLKDLRREVKLCEDIAARSLSLKEKIRAAREEQQAGKTDKACLLYTSSILQDELFHYMTEQGFKGFQRGEYGSTAEHLTSLQYQIKQDKERLEKLQKRIQKEQVKYEPARNVSKTLNEIDSMGQKTITGKMAISKEDYSPVSYTHLTSLSSRRNFGTAFRSERNERTGQRQKVRIAIV